MHYHVDRAVNLLKWPCAALSVLALAPAASTFYEALKPFWRSANLGVALAAGIGLFLLPILFRRRLPQFGFWAAFEHEMTHILFALLTLHPVGSMQATDGNGGWMTYRGNGNWLITISPYFFPTVPLLVGGIALLFPPALKLAGLSAVGFAIAWHVFATIRETGAHQSDIQKVGISFAVAFLPGVSLLCGGFAIALAAKGASGPSWYCAKFTLNLYRMLP
ncbi:MAG: hypothetical protein Q7R40_20190 [Phaeospirillum sp.]|nr:hypothetical protein [Phaeospirillum sp.]